MISTAQTLPLPQNHLGLYLHFPWCLVKCPYCDFLSIPVDKIAGQVPSVTQARQQIPHARYADALINEFRTRLHEFDADSYQIGSIFFGGGTPSLWEPEQLGRVLEVIRSEAPHLADNLEISVECNPSSVSLDFFKRLLAQGVNRVSIGVQSLHEGRLKFLGRVHNQHEGLRAIGAAFDAGFSRVSADLIYGVYQQSAKEALADLDALLQYPLTHLSAYTLTIEPGTRFGALDRAGKLPLLSEDEVARSFEQVSAHLSQAGFKHYEISNFARQEQVSRHNLGYWLARPYLGLGTGAYGRIQAIRYRNSLSAERYLQSFAPIDSSRKNPTQQSKAAQQFSFASQEVLKSTELENELIMLGLRTSYGVLSSDLNLQDGVLSPLLQRRELEYSEANRLRIPRDKWLVSDSIVTKLMHDTSTLSQ